MRTQINYLYFQMFPYIKISVDLLSAHYTIQTYFFVKPHVKRHLKQLLVNCVEVFSKENVLKKAFKKEHELLYCSHPRISELLVPSPFEIR